MKFQLFVLILSLLHIACPNTLPRNLEKDFEKLIDQLKPEINRATIIGGSDLSNTYSVTKLIAKVDFEHTISKVKSLQQELLQRIEELNSKSCRETGKAELGKILSNTLQTVSNEYSNLMDKIDAAYNDGMTKIREYKETDLKFRIKFQDCNDDACKLDVIKEVGEQVGVLGKRITEYVEGVRNQIKSFHEHFIKEILVPGENGFRDRSYEVVHKAEKCDENQKL